MMTMRDFEELYIALQRSSFRRQFRLRNAERRLLSDKGLPTVLAHARDLLLNRLAPAIIANDGKQTPYRGHPVFVAQHATATCCRGCLMKWHGIEKGRALTEGELDYVVSTIGKWIERQGVPMAQSSQTDVGPPLLWEQRD
jgi:hypothetical protein